MLVLVEVEIFGYRELLWKVVWFDIDGSKLLDESSLKACGGAVSVEVAEILVQQSTSQYSRTNVIMLLGRKRKNAALQTSDKRN